MNFQRGEAWGGGGATAAWAAELHSLLPRKAPRPCTRADPAVAVAFDGLNEDRVVGGIAQGVAQALDGAADAAVEIHKDVARPKGLAKLFAGDDFVGTAQQNCQGAKRQVLDPDLDAAPAQFAGTQVGLEHTKANKYRRRLCRAHRTTLLRGRMLSLPPGRISSN